VQEVKLDVETPGECPIPDHTRSRREVYIERPGYEWNQLRGWPRNEPCWCSSGKKAKKCCLTAAPPCVPIRDAGVLKRMLALGEVGRENIRASFKGHAAKVEARVSL
jgi:hypothetical protein